MLIVTVGDFNLPSIDWKCMIPSNDAKSKEFFDLISTHGLIQLVQKPTRLNNILDLVLCNDSGLISDLEVIVPFGMSDHNAITFSIELVSGDTEPHCDPLPIFIWSKTDWTNFYVYCENLNWDDIILNEQTADEMWNSFISVIKTGILKYVPTYTPKKKTPTKRKGLSKANKKLRSLKKKLWKKFKTKSSPVNKEKYKKAAKRYKRGIIAAQEASELKLINSNDPGQFYNHVRKNSVHRSGIAPLKTGTGELVLDNQDKAELLNNYFVSMCTNDNGILPPLVARTVAEVTTLDLVVFSSDQIRIKLKKLKAKISSGPDGLPPIVFKNLANYISSPLAKIYNLLMLKETIPNLWKQANVTPIFKKGSSASPKNYRPISLTCVGSKIFETVIKTVLMPYFEENNFITANQHGFRTRHSTCLNLLESLNDWTENLNAKTDTFIAHIDFARAFDSISIPKLIHKLKWAGIGGPLLACIGSLLTGRTQRVKVGNSYSESLAVTSGVPQGSVIGPLLFIFYINDIANEISPSSIHKLYADDLKAYNTGVNDKEGKMLSNTLQNITRWANDWQLPISTEKSKWLLISNKPKHSKLPPAGTGFQLAGINLPITSEVLDLGVTFNSKLNFSDHISSIIGKAKQKLFLVKKIFVSKNPNILIMAFKTYVIPLLEHCSQVWNPHTVTDIRRLESVQRLFTKRLPGFQGLGYMARLQKANLYTLELRRMWADLCFCYKILRGHVDTPIENFFVLDKSGQTRGHNWKLKTKAARLDSRLHFFSCRVVGVWNSLSPATVNASSIESFKTLLCLEKLDSFLVIKK